MKMRGYAMVRIGETAWIEKDVPTCGPLDAICRPLAVSPCTSDVHTVWEGAIGERHNMILGHEAVGEVVEVGCLVNHFKPGDKVIVSAITPDWNDPASQLGYAQHSGGMLAGWKFSNFKDGVFAEYFHVNDADGNLSLLPEGMSLTDAAMICDMVPTGAHCAELAQIEFGDDVCVIGLGPVGLMATAAAALQGPGHLFAIDCNPQRGQIALEYGASEYIDFTKCDIIKTIWEKTDGRGADRVLIAGGNNDSFGQAIAMLKAGGKIGSVNYLGTGDYIAIPRVEWGCGMGHKQISSGLMPGGRVRTAKLASMVMRGRIDVSKITTPIYHGFDKIEEALLDMRRKPQGLIKPVVII